MYIKIVTPPLLSQGPGFAIVECDRVDLNERNEVVIQRNRDTVSTWGNGAGFRFYVMNQAGDTIDRWSGTAEAQEAPERRLAFHSGETLQLEEGGALNISRYATESGGLRTTITVPSGATMPIPALTDRDLGVLCGRLLAHGFAPTTEPERATDVHT